MCYHGWGKIVLALIIIVFALWDSTISWLPSKWVIVVAAALLLIKGIYYMNGCKEKEAPKAKRRR